jgi:drug/metabolite transporter (DMT)-like permease
VNDAAIPSRLGPLAAVLASIVVGAWGQVLLKQGVNAVGPLLLGSRGLGRLLRALLGGGRLFAGLALYGVSAVLWLLGLSRVDLSYAYPLLALNMVLVTLGARFALGERVSRLRWAGVALIAAGIALVAAS